MTDPPAGIFAAQLGGTTVTVVPLRVTVPDHVEEMATFVGNVNVSRQLLTGLPVAFRTVVVRQ